MPTPADRNSPAPDHVIPFRLPPWFGWSLAFVLLLATGYFAISNFNARSEVDALRSQAQASDIEAKSLKNLLTAEQLISAKQIDALKAAQAEVAKLQTNNRADANPIAKQQHPASTQLSADQIWGKATYGQSTITLVCDGPGPVGTVTATGSNNIVLYHGPLKVGQSVSFPHTSEITIDTDRPGNLHVFDQRTVTRDGVPAGTDRWSYDFTDENHNFVTRITIPAP